MRILEGSGKKGKGLPVHTRKAVGGWSCISTHVEPQRYIEVSGQPNAPPALTRGKETRVPTELLNGPQSWSRRYGEEITSCLCRDSNPRLSGPWPSNYADCATPVPEVVET